MVVITLGKENSDGEPGNVVIERTRGSSRCYCCSVFESLRPHDPTTIHLYSPKHYCPNNMYTGKKLSARALTYLDGIYRVYKRKVLLLPRLYYQLH